MGGRAIGRLTWIAALALAMSACAPMPQRAGIPTLWQPSPNFDQRRPNYVIIHHTGSDTAARALRTLTDAGLAVSAHYLVVRDGSIFQLVDERARAWHAGASYWGGDRDINSASLGIELDNNGEEPYPEVQIKALLALLEDIASRHAIPKTNYLGHGDIAPGRKVDPSAHFPWKTLAEHGFGLWCDAPLPAVPPLFDAILALQALGYDVRDADAAIAAFKRHFLSDETAPLLTESDLGLLNCLAQRKAKRE